VGHFVRMEDERIPEKVLNGKYHNKRSIGWSRIRWEDFVQSDALQILGMWEWRKRHEDREMCGGAFWGSSGPRGGCSAIHGCVERTMSKKLRAIWKEAVVA
jgi:hypothetical protein